MTQDSKPGTELTPAPANAGDLTVAIREPDYYFAAQRKALEARLDELQIPERDADEIVAKRTRKTIRDKALGLFRVGDVIKEILNWNETVDGDLKEAKKEVLLAAYFQKSDENGEEIAKLKNVLVNPQGNTLFSKILRIVDDNPPDLELIEHLASALKYIADSDFERLFEQHRYALAQIEQLTPQALTILADSQRWPLMSLGSRTTEGSKVVSDWLSAFAESYAQSKRISDQAVFDRVQHSINQLIRGLFIEAHMTEGGHTKCTLTSIGRALLPYVNHDGNKR
jgi:hypothetical protein